MVKLWKTSLEQIWANKQIWLYQVLFR